jgi:hypothetical protein
MMPKDHEVGLRKIGGEPAEALSKSPTQKRLFPLVLRASRIICGTMSISDKVVRHSGERQRGPAQTRRQNNAGYGVRESN